MKKKILAAVLAGAMVIGNATLVSAETVSKDTDFGDGGIRLDATNQQYNSRGTDKNFVVDERGVTVTFENEPFKRDNDVWTSFCFETEATDEAKGVSMTAAGNAWNYGTSAYVPETTWVGSWGEDWAKYIAGSTGTLKLTAQKISDDTVTYTVLFTNGETLVYTSVYPNGVPAGLEFHVGADGAIITLLSAEYGVRMSYTEGCPVDEEGVTVSFTATAANEDGVAKKDIPVYVVYTSADGKVNGEGYHEILAEATMAEWLAGFDTGVDATLQAIKVKDNVIVKLEVNGSVSLLTLTKDDGIPESGEVYIAVGSGESCVISKVEANESIATVEEKTVDGFDYDGTWWVNHMAGIAIANGGTEISFKSTTHQDAVDDKGNEVNYFVPLYVAYTANEPKVNGEGYVEYFVGRSDAWGWHIVNNVEINPATGLGVSDGYTWEAAASENDPEWANWPKDCKAGITGTLTATQFNGNVTVEFDVNGAHTKVGFPTDAETVYISLFGQQCNIEEVKVTNYYIDEDIFNAIEKALAENDDNGGNTGDGGNDDNNNPPAGDNNPPANTDPGTGNDNTNTNTNDSVSSKDDTVTVTGNLPAGADRVEVKAPEIKAGDTQATYDIVLVDANGKAVQPKEGTKLTVAIKIPDEFKGKTLYVYYKKDGKIVEFMKSKIDGDVVKFDTTHFSEYVLSTVELEVENPNPGTGVVIVLVPAIAAAAAVAITRKRK